MPESLQELLIAELAELDFEGFDQFDDHMVAWIPENRYDDVSRGAIEQLLGRLGRGAYIRAEQREEPRNWNEEWEAEIKPIKVGRFYITPTWAAGSTPEGFIELLIDPKMSFGTGYHETTRIMLKMMGDAVKPGDKILDAGTGTGILSIAAIKLGAASAFGFDIDEWSYDNAIENSCLNNVSENLMVVLGDDSVIPVDKIYDVVLANINRNILIDMAGRLSECVRPGGLLLISGLLREDEPVILKTTAYESLELVGKESENDWIGLKFHKKLKA